MAGLGLSSSGTGRHSGVPRRLGSAPSNPAFAKAVEKRSGRYNSTQTSTSGSENFYADINPSEYFAVLLRKMKDAHINTSRMEASHFAWLLPKLDLTKRQRQLYTTMLVEPMLVGVEDLKEILQLELSTEDSPSPEAGYNFYTRSYILTGEELRRVIDGMAMDGNDFDELEAWFEVLEIHSRRQNTFTLRYVGMCEAHYRPFDRYSEDRAGRKNGFLYHFNAKLSELYPDIAEAVQIHRLPDAHLPFSDQFNADEVERMLIAFFGYRTLLNRQRGGHYGSYIPTSADVGNFGQLGTSFYHDFLVKARHPDARMVDELGTIFKRVRVDANTDSTTSGTCVYQFTEELQRSITEAATPRQIFGHTLILYTLKDITVEDYYDPRPFIKGGSRAGTLTRAMIRQLAEVEEQEAERFWTDGTFRPTFFTAANLFNTLWHRAPDQAFADLQEYFGIVRPLISATFSRDVNALLLSDFGLENENYLHDSVFPTVGTVTLQHFGETPGTDDAFLSIQHIDPGYDKYEYQPPELRRIMFLTHQITFLVANEAMEVLEEYYQRGQHRDRLTICAEIYGRVEGIKVTPAGRQLFNDLASAKAEYQPMFSSKNIVAAFGRLPSQDPYPLLDFYGRQKILSLGRLAGKPQSYERWQQIEQYWDEHYPDLHVTYPHGDEQSYNDWAALFMGAPENQFWLLHALAHSGKSKYLGILLAQYRPFWKLEEKDWINDEKARHEAAVAAGAWLNTIANHSTRILKTRKQIGLQQPEDVKNLDDLQGSRVSVSGRGNVVRLRWQHQPDGHVNAVEVPAAPAKMISAEDERYLDFTEHGIDVLDGYGVPLRAVTRQGQREATIPKNSFHGYKFGKEVYEMWILVRTRMGHAPPPDADEPDYQWQWDLEQGVNWVQQMTLIEDPVQDRPPWENDANYLLVKFIDERLPEGGKFYLASKQVAPESNEDLAAFVTFLKSAEYAQHPYSMQWLGQLERTPPNSALLGKNLPFFRSCERHQRNVRVKSLGYRLLRCTYYELGPIGSGSAAPDVEEQAKRLKQANAQKGKKRSAEDIESAEGDKGYVPGPGHKIQWHPRAPKRPEREE